MLTLEKVLKNAEAYAGGGSDGPPDWQFRQDAAAKISAALLEQATDIDLFVGRAENKAYDRPGLPASLNAKVRLAERLASCLEKAGKRVKISYFDAKLRQATRAAVFFSFWNTILRILAIRNYKNRRARSTR